MTKTAENGCPRFLLLGVLGCGGLRYSQVSPEAKDFHPRGSLCFPPTDGLYGGKGR